MCNWNRAARSMSSEQRMPMTEPASSGSAFWPSTSSSNAGTSRLSSDATSGAPALASAASYGRSVEGRPHDEPSEPCWSRVAVGGGRFPLPLSEPRRERFSSLACGFLDALLRQRRPVCLERISQLRQPRPEALEHEVKRFRFLLGQYVGQRART